MERLPPDPSVPLNEGSGQTDALPRQDGTMSKYERRIFLDRLIELRAGYRQAVHEATTMTVDGAMAYAVDLLDDLDGLDAILGGSPADSTSTSNTPG